MIIRNLLIATAITMKLAAIALFSQWLATSTDQEPKVIAACPWCYGDPSCEDSTCDDCG